MNLPIRQYFRLLSTYLRPQRGKVFLLTVFLFTGIGLQLVAPQVVRDFIDLAQQGGNAAALRHIAFLFLGVTVISQAVRIFSTYLTEDVKWRATNLLRDDLADHTLHLDMAFHNENTPGTMIERIDGDITELSNFFSQFILKIVGNALLMVGVLVLLYQEDWRVGVAFTVFAVVMMLALSVTAGLGVRFWEGQREAISVQFGFIEEVLGGTEDIRANGGVPYVMDQMRRHIYAVYQATRKAFLVGNLTWGSTNVFFGISGALALGLGIYLYSRGEATLGTVYLLLHYSNTLQRPLEQLARQLQDLQSATASINRIQQLFAIKPKVQEYAAAIDLPGGAQSVIFAGVTFGYEPGDPILRDVSFHLPAGKVMGLLGRTGSGKTTITRLLFRFHDPDGGAVCLSEQDLRQVKLGDVRRSVGMVTQEVQLFQASVRDNLTFFDPSIPDDKIIAAIEMLGLGDWFKSMPKGLDTKLAAGGRGLSAGEAQLLAFTRVFLKDPGLIIMDEASSRLDPVTEQLIERAIDRLLHNRTAIIVAHRLATVQRADDILILQDGAVLEHGNRVALLADPDTRFSELMRTGMEQVLV
ncbi:MAG: ABC transporter ATP-binding protein [Chloroflexi bacterium]|nr:ABC transporter ATP-binding protein [Chloroflexota bacterium]MBP8059942.1 ABC transporter ATP-binding protein [Chloroflexota bacterium]